MDKLVSIISAKTDIIRIRLFYNFTDILISFNQLKTLVVCMLLVIAVGSVRAQAVGDYGTSVNTGVSTNWSTASNWVVCISAGTWTGATVAGTAPTNTKNVWIRTGANYVIDATATSLNLVVQDGGSLSVGGFSLTVSGATTVGGGTSGTLNITSATATKLFTGLVTIAVGAIWTNTSANSPVTFRGGITNNGTFNAGSGVHTFDTNAQSLTGTLSILNVNITTIVVTNVSTSNLSIGTSLSGSGTLTNAGTMNLGGISSIPTLTNTGTLTLGGSGAITGIINNGNGTVNLNSSGTITSFNNAGSTSTLNISALPVPAITTLTANAAGNTVNYNGAGAQTVKTVSYSNLTLGGSGDKTFAVTTVNNNLTLSGSATATTGANLTIGGALSIGDGTTLTVPAFTLGVTGITTIGGGTSGTLAITSTAGTKTFTGAVTINSGGAMSENVNEALTFGSDLTIVGTLTENGNAVIGIAGSLINNGTYSASTGTHTFSGSGKIISGSTAISIGTVALTGSYTNSGSLTVGSSLSGAGSLTNTGTLNINGTCSVGTLSNSGTTAITGSGAISTVLANFTNNGTLNLGGSGGITGITNNGTVNLVNSGTISSFNNASTGSILNISDLTPPTISTLTVSTSGNTVNYNGAGAQLIKDVSYSNINFSGSGTKTYTVGGARTANALTVASGVTLLLNGANTLTPINAIINGGVKVTNGIVIAGPNNETGDGAVSLAKGSGTISFTNGSFFNDSIDGGVIPTALWDINSTCYIRGYVSNANGTTVANTFQASLHQDFGNFIWNSTGQQSLAGTLTVTSLAGQLTHVKGNLTIVSTGTGAVALGNGGTGNLTIDGSFTQTGGKFILSALSAKQMSVAGNFTVSGGTFDLSSSTTAGNYTTLNVGGNFSFPSGTITESGTTTASIINFNGTTGKQVFTSGGTLSNTVNFAILPGAIVDFGTSSISSGSNGGFTLYPGGTLTTANTSGITTTGTTGSIQLSGTRTYNAGANYIYNGTSAQATGNGLTQNNPASVTISNTNSAGVTFSAATTMNYLIINNGAIANLGTFTHTASALFLSGDAYSTGTWGGTGSGASTINTTYFTANSGIVTLSNAVREAYLSSTTITIPCGVTSVIAEVWGGGGAGSTLVTLSNGGGGGGGGAYSRGVVTVTPQATYTITVGGGGSGTISGGDSWFGSSATVMAKGGSGATTDSGTGATGGQAAAGVTTAGGITLSGGNGASASGSGISGYAGGGGSSAGTVSAGVSATSGINTGASAPAGGGNGGNGGAGSTGPGGAGSTPGGGGGGAYRIGSGISTGGSGGSGQVIITFTNVIPTITLGSSPTVCQGSTTASLTYSAVTGCPDKYSIVYDATAHAAGFVDVSFATLTSSPIVFSVPAGAAVATYQGNLTLLNSSTGSPSTKYPITATVNPTAVVSDMTTTTCSGGAFTATPANGTNGTVPIGTTYSWSAPAVTGGMTGGTSGSGVSAISGTLTNPTNTTQTATYTVIPLSGSCSGNAFTVIVTVNPIPALTAMTSIACSGGAFTVTPVNSTNGIVPAGTTYSWTAPVVTGGMTGGSSGSNASAISGTLTNPTNTVQTATYTVTPLSGSCSGNSTFTLTITVNPTPALTAMTTSAASGGAFTVTPVNGTNGLVPSGTTYSWPAPSGTGFSGGAASSGTPGSITGTLTLNTSTTTATATYTVTPTSGSCSGNTFTVTVTITPNLWLGTVSSTDWGVGTNWVAGIPPADGADVVFASAPNNDLVLDGDRTIGNLTNTSSKRLFVPAGKSLTINGAINTNNDSTRIYIQSSSSGPNGTLIFKTTSPVYGTVEMYSQAFCNNKSTTPKSDFKWQFFGIPVENIKASPTFDGSYVRSWDERQDTLHHWVRLTNDSILRPFYGYEITQLDARTIAFQGKLVNRDFNSGVLAISPAPAAFPGQHIFANPYTAAINIKNINFGSDTEHTVYMYNTGSLADWRASYGTTSTSGITPGQYTAIPQLVAGNLMQLDVPSMQAMLIRPVSTSFTNFTFGLSYNSVVMKNISRQRMEGDKTQSTADSISGTYIVLKGTTLSDRMWLFSQTGCTRSFDNGWDGVKIPGTALAPQIYAIEPDNNYQVDALEDLNNTQLGFQAGVDTVYTLTFTHQNLASKYAGIFLLDLVENKTTDITTSGSTYSFSAESVPATVKRFLIATRSIEKNNSDNTQLKVFNSGNTVFVQNLSNLNGEMIVYDMMGRNLKRAAFGPYGVTAVQVSAVTGAYIVIASTDNEKVSEKIIIGK